MSDPEKSYGCDRIRIRHSCSIYNILYLQVHEHGYKAHVFTFRNEWQKLYWDHGQDPYRYRLLTLSGQDPYWYRLLTLSGQDPTVTAC